MRTMVGLIMPSALASLAAYPVLLCDGQTYSKADYPLLYAALSSAYIVDADNFTVPDLRGVFIRGVNGANPIGSTGGSDTHTLTENEMPSHTHDNTPHSHSEVSVITGLGGEIPATGAIPSASLTGASSVTILATGGGQAHNNIPSYHALNFVILAG